MHISPRRSRYMLSVQQRCCNAPRHSRDKYENQRHSKYPLGKPRVLRAQRKESLSPEPHPASLKGRRRLKYCRLFCNLRRDWWPQSLQFLQSHLDKACNLHSRFQMHISPRRRRYKLPARHRHCNDPLGNHHIFHCRVQVHISPRRSLYNRAAQ